MNNYFSGGLAEIVTAPSPLTYSYFKKWFSGSGPLGRAMKLIGLPVENLDLPILELLGSQLVLNLENEEKTLYGGTIFKYKKQQNIYDYPKLTIDFLKILSPTNWFKTFQILIRQSIWISNPEKVVKIVSELIADIPDKFDKKDIDNTLTEKIWPVVLAVGALAEFFSEITKKNRNYISEQVAKKDWFFASLADQSKVKQGEMSYKDYINLYGLRADKDYELTCPRWYEIPDEIKSRIEKSNFHLSNKLKSKVSGDKTTEAAIQIQILRLEAKRKALFFINKLRISLGRPKEPVAKPISKPKSDGNLKNGKGIGVSKGSVSGKAKHINSQIEIEKGTIGIFPNAGTDFSVLYPKCAGLIFLQGGQTSHGAIVAREFKIPALIDAKASGIKDGFIVEIDGETGQWRIV